VGAPQSALSPLPLTGRGRLGSSELHTRRRQTAAEASRLHDAKCAVLYWQQHLDPLRVAPMRPGSSLKSRVHPIASRKRISARSDRANDLFSAGSTQHDRWMSRCGGWRCPPAKSPVLAACPGVSEGLLDSLNGDHRNNDSENARSDPYHNVRHCDTPGSFVSSTRSPAGRFVCCPLAIPVSQGQNDNHDEEADSNHPENFKHPGPLRDRHRPPNIALIRVELFNRVQALAISGSPVGRTYGGLGAPHDFGDYPLIRRLKSQR
jgi:hypothetical protein